MPARPISPESLQLIDAVRSALGHRSDVEERTLFGGYAFMVDGKLCLGVRNGELLVRLPPDQHQQILEMQNTRELAPGRGMKGYFWVEPNGFATRAQWKFWIDGALAFNPLAKATPKRKPKQPTTGTTSASAAKATTARKRHSVFDADD